jgi:hypothetical protein
VVAEDKGGEEVALGRRADLDARVDEVGHGAPARGKEGQVGGLALRLRAGKARWRAGQVSRGEKP